MPIERPTWLFIASILLTLGLAACGTSTGPGNGGGGNGGDTTKLGFVGVSERESPSSLAISPAQTVEVEGFAAFWGLDEPLPSEILTDPYSQVEDTCDVFDPLDPDPNPGTLPDFGDFEFTFLDAGESITIESQGASYLTLAKGQQGSFIIYEGSASGSLATGLTASVPGDPDFPQFTDESIPDVAAFGLTSSLDVGVDTQFTWSSSGATNAVVSIEVFSQSDFTTVSCIAVDDGSFEFPAETKAELGQAFSGQVTSASRDAYRVAQSGDAALILVASSVVEYDVPIFVPFDESGASPF